MSEHGRVEKTSGIEASASSNGSLQGCLGRCRLEMSLDKRVGLGYALTESR